MKRIFKSKEGSILPKDKVQQYGEFLWKLKGGIELLTPSQVVEAATPKKSPIHDYFVWDDEEAGEKFRLHQARMLLNQITVEVIIEGNKEDLPAFHNVIVKSEETERGYVSIEQVRQNPAYYEIVLGRAREDLKTFRKRYEQYRKLNQFKPLEPVFKTLDQLQINA